MCNPTSAQWFWVCDPVCCSHVIKHTVMKECLLCFWKGCLLTLQIQLNKSTSSAYSITFFEGFLVIGGVAHFIICISLWWLLLTQVHRWEAYISRSLFCYNPPCKTEPPLFLESWDLNSLCLVSFQFKKRCSFLGSAFKYLSPPQTNSCLCLHNAVRTFSLADAFCYHSTTTFVCSCLSNLVINHLQSLQKCCYISHFFPNVSEHSWGIWSTKNLLCVGLLSDLKYFLFWAVTGNWASLKRTHCMYPLPICCYVNP